MASRLEVSGSERPRASEGHLDGRGGCAASPAQASRAGGAHARCVDVSARRGLTCTGRADPGNSHASRATASYVHRAAARAGAGDGAQLEASTCNVWPKACMACCSPVGSSAVRCAVSPNSCSKARARDVLLEEQPALPQRSAEGARVVRRREAGE